ncbi:MAG: glycosyltransferase [Acidimicrobiales bacterium]|nr:glycosyltransferase [Acidimicrobiales bacterium]
MEVVPQSLSRGYEALRRRRPGVAALLNDRSLDRLLHTIGVTSYWTYTMGAFSDWAKARRGVLRGIEVIDPIFEGDANAVWKTTARVARMADLLLATAPSLVEELQRRGLAAGLLPNAVSDALIVKNRPAPAGPPLAVYVGTVDWRFDASLLAGVAERLAHCRFVIAGRVNSEATVAALRLLPNVEVKGTVTEAEKIALLSSAHVGLVPFVAGPISDGVNPTKVYEYSAYGLPVVAFDSAACRALSPPVRVAKTADSFSAAIQEALTEGTRSTPSIRFARANTWEHRADELHRLMLERETAPSNTRASTSSGRFAKEASAFPVWAEEGHRSSSPGSRSPARTRSAEDQPK